MALKGIPEMAGGCLLGYVTLYLLEQPADTLLYFIVSWCGLFGSFLFPNRFQISIILLIISISIGRPFYFGEISSMHKGGALSPTEFYLSDFWLLVLVGYRLFDVKARFLIHQQWWRIDFAIVMLLVWCIFSAIASDHRFLGFAEVIKMLKVTLLYFLISRIREKSDIVTLCIGLLVALILQSTMVAYLYFGGEMPFNLFQNVDIEEVSEFEARRIGSTLGGSASVAMFFELLIPIAFSLYLCKVGSVYYKGVIIIVTLLAFGAMSCTFSRTGLATLCVSILTFSWYIIKCKGLGISLLKLMLGISILVPMLGVYVASILPRLDRDYLDRSKEYRAIYNEIAELMVYDNPIVGVGLNSFYENVQRYGGYRIANMELYGVHNVYLAFAAEAGLPCILILIWIYIESFLLAKRSMVSTHLFIKALSGGILAAITGLFFVSNNMEMGFKYAVPIWWYLWILLGILVAISKFDQQSLNIRSFDWAQRNKR